MLALNLDDALSDATARAAHFLQPRRELGELRFVKGQSPYHRYTLAPTAGNFSTDAHARRGRGGARRLLCRAGRLCLVPHHAPWCVESWLHAEVYACQATTITGTHHPRVAFACSCPAGTAR